MIEDSLKTARNAERLLLAASVVALLFVLSIKITQQEQTLLDDIQNLSALANSDYGLWVGGRVARKAEEDSAGFGNDQLEAELEDVGLQIVGVSQIAERLSEPAHVGRLLVDQLPFGDEDTTLAELDRLFGQVPFDRDVQIVGAAVDPTELRQSVLDFLDASVHESPLGTRRARIEDVQLYPVESTSEIIDSYLPMPSGTALLLLEFKLYRDAGAVPIFNEDLTGTSEILPDSSYLDWLSDQKDLDSLAAEVDGEWRWLPDRDLTEKERNVPLPELREALAEEIDKAKASNQIIRLPGVAVPGELALVAIPLAFIGLVWIYLSHLWHLHDLVGRHREAFEEFAWPPLSDRSGFWWPMASIPALVLPLLVLGILAWRLPAFESARALGLVLCLAGAVVVASLGFRCLRWLGRIRREVDLGREGRGEAEENF